MLKAALRKVSEPYVAGVASRVLGQVISFFSVAIASRYLGLDIFGTYALAWAATVIGNTFVFTGFYQALLRAGDDARSQDTFFWLILAVGGLSTAGILLAGSLAGGLQSAQGFALMALAPIPLLIAPAAWWEALLVRDRRVRSASLYVLGAELGALIVVILMLRHGWQIEALIAGRYASVVIGGVLTGGMVRRLPRVRFSRKTTRRAARTALPLWGTTSVGLFSNYGTDIILGAFAAPAMIGAYRGGARIAITASDLVLQPLGLLTWSRFTRIEKENGGPEAMREAWIANMALAAALIWPLSAVVALLAPELVSAILDDSWLPAAGVVAILSVSRAILFFSALLEQVMTVADRGRIQLAIRLAGAASLLVMLVVFARYGAEAASYAHLASSVLVAILSLVAMKAVLELSIPALVATFLPGFALTVLISAVIIGTKASRLALGPDIGLFFSLSAVVLAWIAVAALFLRRRLLVLPAP